MPAAPVIRDRTGVEAVVRDAETAGRFALDFEFLWERTYRPVPCLAQIAVDGDVAIIDPLEGAPLDPIAEMVASDDVETVMHAPSADLTLLALHFGIAPRRIVDVQLVAGFVGLGAGQSLATLLDRTLRVRLEKVETYSDWSKRPLSRAQLAYAESDVTHLLPLADELARRVGALGRDRWVAEEHARRYGPDARLVTDPRDAWRRVKGQGRLNARERSVLRELADWREREALRRDRPPSWILQDRVLVDIARRKPADRGGLSEARGVAERMRPAEVDAILQAIRVGLSADEIALPTPPRPESAARIEVLGVLGQLIVAVRAEGAKLAPQLLATRDEVERFVAAVIEGGAEDHPLASGWRREIAGDALIALATGRLGLAPDPSPPYLVELERGD